MENFDSILGLGILEKQLIDMQYKECKAKTNLNLFKMASGNYKIMDYYKNVVSTHDNEMDAKKEFIRLVNGEVK